MTELNKQRVAKYYLIMRGLNLNFDLFEPRYSPYEIRAINCAIAELEAVIENIDWHEFETPNEQLELLQAELTELKQLLV